VIVADTLLPGMALFLDGARALVSEHGGPLGHGAALARELGLPHVGGARGATPNGVSPSLVRISCPDGAELGIPEPFSAVLSRSYPRAAPGRLTALTSDPATGAMTLTGEAPGASGPAAQLDLWVPDRGNGAPTIGGSGFGDVDMQTVDGGYRFLVEVSGCYVVTASPPGITAYVPADACATP
jgi:hypothetical protein